MTIEIGTDTGGLTTVEAARDALVAAINVNGTVNGTVTAFGGFLDGELTIIADNDSGGFISGTAIVVNDDADTDTPILSVSNAGIDKALRALANGLSEASTVASTIQAAVQAAGNASGTARNAADGLAPVLSGDALTAESASAIVTAANGLTGLTLSADNPSDVVNAAQILAEIAEAQVDPAQDGAATANAQATVSQQAAFQAAAGLSLVQQAIQKARNEADLRIKQEARDSAPVAGDDTIGDGETDNGTPIGASADGDDVVLEDQAVTFDVLSNDLRADGGALSNATIASVGQPAHGKITIIPEVEEFNFDPTFNHGDQITLTVNGLSITYTLTSELIPEQNAALFANQINGNAALSAVVSAVSGSRGGALELTSAVPGTPITVSATTPTNTSGFTTSTSSLVPNGRVTYTPDANYNGIDTFTYTVSNGATPPAFDTATVTIDVTAVNDNPDAKNDFITTANDTTAVSKTAAAGLLANDTDIDTGDSLNIIKVNGGTVGTPIAVTLTLPDNSTAQAQVTVNADGSFTVDPNGQFNQLAVGQSATGTLTYTVSDGNIGTDDQTIGHVATTGNITAVSQVDTVTLTGSYSASDTLSVTVEGQTVTFVVPTGATPASVRSAFINAINANSNVNSIVTASNGGTADTILLTGKTAGSAFTATGGGTGVSSATTTTSPVSAQAQVSTYTVGGTVEAGDVFEITVNGTRISHTVTTETTANQVRDALITKLNANNVIVGKVTASAGGGGEIVVTAKIAGQAFTTSAQAINAGTDVATLTVTVTGSNAAPVANADTASGNEDTTISGTLTATDPDLGDTKEFSLAPGGQATRGTVTINSNGDFDYVPDENVSGTDTFTFRVTDSTGQSSTATVTVTITAVNDDPVVTLSSGTQVFDETGPAVLLDDAMSITDVDSANFDSGQFLVTIANGTPDDRLSIQDGGGITTSGSSVLFNGTEIGTFTGGTDGSTPLNVTLDADATPAAVTALGRAIAYDNVGAVPVTIPRSITVDVFDGDGGSVGETITLTVLLEGGLARADFVNTNSNNDWFDAGNWSTGTLPDGLTIAFINADADFDTSSGLNGGGTIHSVAKLQVATASTLTAVQGTLDIAGPSEVAAGGFLNIGFATVEGDGALALSGALNMAGGVFAMADLSTDASAGGVVFLRHRQCRRYQLGLGSGHDFPGRRRYRFRPGGRDFRQRLHEPGYDRHYQYRRRRRRQHAHGNGRCVDQ